MSFVGKWIGGLAKDLGLVDTPAAPAPAPVTPTVANSSADLDTAAQTQAAAMAGGKTSTLLNGSQGVDDTKNTSKVLLGR